MFLSFRHVMPRKYSQAAQVESDHSDRSEHIDSSDLNLGTPSSDGKSSDHHIDYRQPLEDEPMMRPNAKYEEHDLWVF